MKFGNEPVNISIFSGIHSVILEHGEIYITIEGLNASQLTFSRWNRCQSANGAPLKKSVMNRFI